MLHFAYGSNMSRTLMYGRCPTATAIGPARLAGWRYIITCEGYASIVTAPGSLVQGVLWRLGVRDLAVLNAYESLDSGLYRRRMLPVNHAARRVPALVYLAPERCEGRSRPGYQAVVVAAARDWGMPADYIRELERWAPSRWRGARATETGEIA